MFVGRCFLAVLLAALPVAASAQSAVSVMVIGGYHMSNPGRDLHNVHADDVLAPKRQAEIAATVAALARFRPTQVDVEWPADLVTQRYDAYTKGTLAPSHNEVVQLGFRLAQASGASVHGVDVDGDFPYDAVQAYARAHGGDDVLASANADVQSLVQQQQQQDLLKTATVPQVLRWLNGPAMAREGNNFYRTMLKIGGAAEQPGADLLTAWHKRNFYICANIVQLAKPGDRVVVFYGSGHEFLLRQCVSEMPGYKLVEPNDYLPE
jgi:Family of unknown function (DUF5694)